MRQPIGSLHYYHELVFVCLVEIGASTLNPMAVDEADSTIQPNSRNTSDLPHFSRMSCSVPPLLD